MEKLANAAFFCLVVIILGACKPLETSITPESPPTATAFITQNSTASATSTSTATVTPTLATSKVTIRIDEAILETPVGPFEEEGILYVPAAAIMRALGYEKVGFPSYGVGTNFINGQKSLPDGSLASFSLWVDDRSFYIRENNEPERQIMLPAATRTVNGEIMAPVDFISGATGFKTEYDPVKGEVNILTGRSMDELQLQAGAPYLARVFVRQTSTQLAYDNRLEKGADGLSRLDLNRVQLDENHQFSSYDALACGVKRLLLNINSLDWEPENWTRSEMDPDPRYLELYKSMKEKGIEQITFNLIYKDKDFHSAGGQLGYPRFQNAAEIERFLEYVRWVARYFRGVVDVYEMWNEPNIEIYGQYIAPEDYIRVAKRVAAVIREEDPGAKFSVGQTTQYNDPASRAYTDQIIRSDLMPLVDAISIHPLFWDSPEHETEFYYAYPRLLEELKTTAWEHGFRGEFMGTGGNYAPGQSLHANPQGVLPTPYSPIIAGKYGARGTVTTLAHGFSSNSYFNHLDGLAFTMSCNLNTLMSGALPVKLDITASGERLELLRAYSFLLPDSFYLIALWVDDVAEEQDLGDIYRVTIGNMAEAQVHGIDILNSTIQVLETKNNQTDLVIEDLVIRDYPIFMKIQPVGESH